MYNSIICSHTSRYKHFTKVNLLVISSWYYLDRVVVNKVRELLLIQYTKITSSNLMELVFLYEHRSLQLYMYSHLCI
jgi:hypothetical protein